MSWWSKMKRKLTGARGDAPSPKPPPQDVPAACWRDAADNRFGVRVLDLTPITQTMLSATEDPTIAARSVGWGTSTGDELDDAALRDVAPIACELRYPAASVLPDGLLFTPSCMEEKWVLAYRRGVILAARSWTGIVEAVAETRRDGDELVVHALRFAEPAALRSLGDPVQTFDWLIRSHALGQVLPLPASDDGLRLLEATPIAVFSPFGAKALCAARAGRGGGPVGAGQCCSRAQRPRGGKRDSRSFYCAPCDLVRLRRAGCAAGDLRVRRAFLDRGRCCRFRADGERCGADRERAGCSAASTHAPRQGRASTAPSAASEPAPAIVAANAELLRPRNQEVRAKTPRPQIAVRRKKSSRHATGTSRAPISRKTRTDPASARRRRKMIDVTQLREGSRR